MALAVSVPLVIAWMVYVVHRGAPHSFPSAVSLGLHACACGTLPDPPGANGAHAASMEEALEEGQRLPVLYLRAFNQESQFFIIGTKERYGRWAKSFHAAISKENAEIWLTLEEYLGKDLCRRLGHLLCSAVQKITLRLPALYEYMQRMTKWKLSRSD